MVHLNCNYRLVPLGTAEFLEFLEFLEFIGNAIFGSLDPFDSFVPDFLFNVYLFKE